VNQVDNGAGGGSADIPQLRSEAELRNLDAVKWSRYQEPVLPAWVADMDIAPPQFVVDAIVEFARSRDFGYNFAATDALIPAFCQWQSDKHGWSPDPGKVRRFCDVLHAIDVALWLHTEPGDGIVLLTPVYPPFIDAVTGVDRRIIDVPLQADNGWRLDPERLEAAIDDRTKVLLLCHPHNPTGRVFDEGERQAIAKVVIDNDLLLISDEVWADLTHPGARHVPMEMISGLEERTLTVTSASKPFNLAGLRCAVGHIGHHELAKKFESLPPHFLGAVSGPGAVASLSCWTVGTPWLEATRRYLTDRRDQLTRRLAADAPTIGLLSPEATYLAWLDVSALDLGPDPSKALLDRFDIALNPGTDFGPHGQGFVRLNFATSAEILDRICDRLASAAV
jgi:cystathionine beta-lyase